MKIEKKLTCNNISKHLKRTLFTTISIMLCSTLIFTSILLVSSIKSGIDVSANKDYFDYHFIIKDINLTDFNKFKNNNYIDKIYIQTSQNNNLIKYENHTNLSSLDTFNVYIKYNNVNDVCKYSTDIIQNLELPVVSMSVLNNKPTVSIENKYSFNNTLLTTYGIIDVSISENNDLPVCRARINYSFVINLMIIFIYVTFSILSIIILYNAFFITINERKKEYAILNSVGATESQLIKIVLNETIFVGIIGIALGFLISYLTSSQILKALNTILINTGYNITLILDIKYIIFSLILIICNLYISAIIPCIRASTSSIIQGIKNNSGIKRKRITLLEKILPVEGKIATKNIRRTKNNYNVITILLVVCMVSYISISTYINYEKKTADIVNQYDTDAELRFDYSDPDMDFSNIDYTTFLNNYKVNYDSNLKYIEYKMLGLYFLVNPENAIGDNDVLASYPLKDNKQCIRISVIRLDDMVYQNYLDKINGKYGDYILYNKITLTSGIENLQYSYFPAFKKDSNVDLDIVGFYVDTTNSYEYEIIDSEILHNHSILTDYLIEGFKEFPEKYHGPILFVNSAAYKKIEEKFNNFVPQNQNFSSQWIWGTNNTLFVKIKCDNIIKFSNYISSICNKQDIMIDAEYFSLDNQEKIIFINVIHFILSIIIVAVVIIGIVSMMNIVNASLCEREQDFYIFHSIGTTKANITGILIYEGIYVFIKSTIISIILSMPILYTIITYMENIIVLDTFLIPFGSISAFFGVLLLIILCIMAYSTQFIEEK